MVISNDLAGSDAMADIRRSNMDHSTFEGETNATETGSTIPDRGIFRDRLHRSECTAMNDDNGMEAGTLFLTIVTGSLLISMTLILLIGIQP
jgi:hypothetical protein